MKLLLFDPFILAREWLGITLAGVDSVEVEIASTAEDFTRIMRTIRPEVVVLRARSPDGSSIEALSRVRSEYPSICVIVVYDIILSDVYVKHWKLAGADYCFDLFLQLDQLLDTVRQLGIAAAHADKPFVNHLL